MAEKGQTCGRLCRGRILCGLIGLLLIAGIGDAYGKEKPGSRSSDSSKPIRACEVLTKSDAEAILGGVVDEPRQSFNEKKDGFWMSTCNYYSPAKSGRAGILIKKSQDADPVRAFELHTASLKKAMGEKYKLQPVDGVGVRACWDGSLKQLTVFEGSRTLIITVGRPGEGEKAALETAKMVAARVLPGMAKSR